MTDYEVIYTTHVNNWNLRAFSPIVPSVGELVDLPHDGMGKVVAVVQVYKTNKDEDTVFDHFIVYLDWKIS